MSDHARMSRTCRRGEAGRQSAAWSDTSGARVRILPPLLFAVPLGLAALVHRRWPLPAGPVPRRHRMAGTVLAGAGLGLMVWAFWTMRTQRTTVVPWAQVDRLVTTGPFARVRNPIYAADVLVYVGVSLRMGSLWPLLMLPAVLRALYRWVIVPEQAYLTGRFPRDYPGYQARVPALVPRIG